MPPLLFAMSILVEMRAVCRGNCHSDSLVYRCILIMGKEYFSISSQHPIIPLPRFSTSTPVETYSLEQDSSNFGIEHPERTRSVAFLSQLERQVIRLSGYQAKVHTGNFHESEQPKLLLITIYRQ